MFRLLLLFIIFIGCAIKAESQMGYLFVKKGGKKKKEYVEGDRIYLRVTDGTVKAGVITRLMNDTIYLSGHPIPRVDVTEVLLPSKKNTFEVDSKTLLLITGGVILVTAGLTLSNQLEFGPALATGATIGYGPLLIKYAASKISFKRKKFKIGKKYRLQVLDFYLPRPRGF